MAAQVVVEMTADEADLFRAQQKLLAQQNKMNSGYGKGAREAQKLERAAKKIYESTRTPAEQHIARLRQLKDTLKSGKIDQETFNRAVEQSRDKFRQVTGTLSKQEVQARKTAEANKVMTQKQAEAAARLSREQAEAAARQSAAARKYEQEQAGMAAAARRVHDATRTPLERHQRELRELNQLYRAGKLDVDTYRRAVDASNRELTETAATGRRAFGAEALGGLKSYAAGFLGVAAAAGAVLRVLRDLDAQKEEAAQRARASRMGMSSLAQLADSPEEFKRLTGEARRIYGEGGFDSLDQAARTVFSVQSAGQLGQLDLFADLRKQGLIETPDIMARAAATLMTSMGQQETGNARAIVSKAFGASKFSPASAEALLESASRSGGSARAMGLHDEEVLAAIAVTATASGTAEQGGTRLASLLRSLDQSGEFKGQSLMHSVQSIQARGLDSAGLQELLGREEAVQGYRDLVNNQDLFGQALNEVSRAQRHDLVGLKLRLPSTDPVLAASLAQDRADAGLAGMREQKFSASRGLANAVLSEREANILGGSEDSVSGSLFGDSGRAFDAWVMSSLRKTGRTIVGASDEGIMAEAVREQRIRNPDLMAQVLATLDVSSAKGEVVGHGIHDLEVNNLLKVLQTSEQYEQAARMLVDSSNSLRDVTDAMKKQAQDMATQSQRVSDPHMHTE